MIVFWRVVWYRAGTFLLCDRGHVVTWLHRARRGRGVAVTSLDMAVARRGRGCGARRLCVAVV